MSTAGAPYGREAKGPPDLPFDHDDVRVYIDNLFVEGMLRPVDHDHADALVCKWVKVGLVTSPEADRTHRLDGLVKIVTDSLPTADARYHDWLKFAYRWAELTALWHVIDAHAEEASESISKLQGKVESAFSGWVEGRYGGLHNQPPIPPVMLHHVSRTLARHIGKSRSKKAALVVVDGLALDQWVVLRGVLLAQRPELRFREEAVFAWVPTITSVSRQAAFAGKPPLYFPSSIDTTNRDAAGWTQFWGDQGLSPSEVAYARSLRDGGLDVVEHILSKPKVRAVGLVVDKVDKIMHGMELGSAGMHNQVRQWAEQGFMSDLLVLLQNKGFATFLTSDHGNVEAEGCGSPSEGSVADLRGQRARVYPDAVLRSRIKEQFPEAIEWPPFGLPDDFLPLLAPARTAFVRKGERIVGHGGISLEELVVPLVQIERRATP